jgi:hypothetical protein
MEKYYTDEERQQLQDEKNAKEMMDILADNIITVPQYKTVHSVYGGTYNVITGYDEIPAIDYYNRGEK